MDFHYNPSRARLQPLFGIFGNSDDAFVALDKEILPYNGFYTICFI